ncbi:MAG TPA: methylated-DNA--[protein]-cysteine S-methyltransferase [Candidatus Acetothermia bacterium]|nr:methylated-DNA--[protein]-cysteine S-methyltransferase [Candidatus Acetothermia bacterium]
MGIHCAEISTSWGTFCGCFGPRGLRRLFFPGALCPRTAGELSRWAALLQKELDAYFRRESRAFSVPLDPLGTPFQRRVWEELRLIPYGRTVTYGELARKLGRPKAARAVGNAVAANPIPILIPCHRVLPKGKGIGNFGPGIQWKERLLRLEGALKR